MTTEDYITAEELDRYESEYWRQLEESDVIILSSSYCLENLNYI